MSLPKKHVIRIGLDFDGVVAYNPVRIIRAPVAFFKQYVLGIKKLRFFVPKTHLMRFLYILAHETSVFPAIGASKLRALSMRSDIELYLITARFHFLKPSLYRWLDRWHLKSVFKGIYVNTTDRQPHEHKLDTIRKLHLDYFVEDNWDIVSYLDGKTKTIIYWVYNINDHGKKYHHKVPYLKRFFEDIHL